MSEPYVDPFASRGCRKIHQLFSQSRTLTQGYKPLLTYKVDRLRTLVPLNRVNILMKLTVSLTHIMSIRLHQEAAGKFIVCFVSQVYKPLLQG